MNGNMYFIGWSRVALQNLGFPEAGSVRESTKTNCVTVNYLIDVISGIARGNLFVLRTLTVNYDFRFDTDPSTYEKHSNEIKQIYAELPTYLPT